MLLVTGPLAKFVFGTGMRVLEMCHEAKQCEVQVARIGVRTQNVLGTLKNAGEHFSDEAQLETSLLELKGVFEILQSLVGRCGLPASYSKRASAAVLRRKNPNKQALTDAEAKLEQITKDLGLPMLTDIKQQLNRMQNESAASASRDTDVLAEVIRSEIQKAMMVSVGSGVTIKDIIDAKVARIEGDTYHECKRAPPAETAVAGGAERGQAASVGAPPSKKVGSMVMMLGRVRYDKLKEKEVLGQGTFGVVLAGTYEGREVAIKRARGCLGSTQIIEAFRQEVEIQYAMRHANIVEVIAFGLGDAERPPCLVMERMHESLYDLLGVQGIDLDPVSKVSIVQDVSEGLRFLHSRGIVHRDLKSLNILLDDAWTAKISDFGLAKVNSSIATATGGGFYSKVGSDFWMAPEVHSNRKATRASDVFSLHVVMWEVLAQERAGHGKPIGERLQTNPTARLPPMDMDCSAAVESNLRNIVDRCGCSVPSERPKMDEVCSVVTAVLDHLESPQENPLEEVAAVPAPQPQLQPHEEERQQQDQQQQDQQQQQQREQRPPEERQEQRGAEASEQHDEHVSTQEQQTHQRQTPQQHHQQQPPPPPPQEEEEGGKQEERKVQEEEQKEASTEKQGPQQELQQAQQEQGEQTKRQQEERLEDERRGEQEEEEEKGGEENKQKQEQNEQEAEQDSQENEQEEQEKEQQETEQDAHEFEQERQKKKQQPQPRKASPSFMGRLRRTKKNRAPRDDKRGGATRVEQPKQEEPQDEQDSETQGEQHEDQGEQQEQEQEQPEQQKEEEEKEAGPQETEDPQGEAKHEQSEQQERERSKRNPSFMKRLGRRSKKDRPHGTTGTGTGETAVLSVGSNASSSSSSSTSKPRPEQRPRQSLDGTSRPALVTPTARKVSSMGSPQPTQHDSGDELPPPYVSSESEASSPVTAKRDRRTDRAVLFKLLRQWSPSSATNNSTARSAWTHSTGWGTRIAMGDWHGVCTRYEDDEEGRYERVTAMKLPMNGLSGDLLEGVTTLDCLVDLDLKDNHLTGVLSASIRNLRLLETLDLSGTKLTGTIPRELGDLVALTVLDLHQTSLHGDIPETLGNLVCLETLDLSSCDLSGCIPTEFERLKALRVLRLGHNRLTGEIPAVLATLDRLEEINLGGNQLTGKILAVSGSWPGLRVLDMSDNRLEGCIPPELVEFEHLTTLILYRNFGITGSIPPWIGSMASLEEMDLSAMQLGGEIPQELGQLTRLTRLSLGSCGLVGTIPPELGQLKSLKHLALYDNDLTGTFPREVLKIPTLRNVNFENNNFTVKKAVISGRKSAIKSMLPRGCSLRL